MERGGRLQSERNREPGSLAELLGLEADEQVQIVLSFGYPARARDPEARPPEEWIRRADRRPLEEVARHL